MCVNCGCGKNAKITVTQSPERDSQHPHTLPNGTVIVHSHDHHHHEHQDHHHAHHPEQNLVANPNKEARRLYAQVHRTTLTLEQNLFAKNDLIASKNRALFQSQKILALNLVSSLGLGKMTLLTCTLQDLQKRLPISVIEGDQENINDAQRIRATLVIENVSNLVCPALFDLGEAARVAILSVTEGEDKPLKYPHMFWAAQMMILNKIDLLPYVSFDCDHCLDYAGQGNPKLEIF
ncbi:MAG: hydrogenase accessory protein HypB [Merismopediaceae bacterium]|nr:hydrogenase accessory protein HypB [Merismopediaceae bacterium]